MKIIVISEKICYNKCTRKIPMNLHILGEVKMSENVKKSARVYLLDEIRGFAILCMVVYHTMYQLKYSFGVDVPIFFEGWFNVIRDIFAGAFIFISGIMCRFSHDNLRRGVKCFFLGMVITFVTPFFSSEGIAFGILHFLGISMMLYGLFGKVIERLPSLAGIIICAILAVITWNISLGFIGIPGVFEWNLPLKAYEVGVLFPFGLYNADFRSSDYFSIFPWIFVFLAGSYFGLYAKEHVLPEFFYRSHIKWLGTVGKYTIWIYILHVPVIFLIFSLIFR